MIKLAIIAITASLLTAPIAAQNQNSSRLEKADIVARSTIGAIYGEAGTRACGAKCGYASRKVGVKIYDKSQDLSRRAAKRIQEAGRKMRERRNGDGK
jgi:hypothetical protein